MERVKESFDTTKESGSTTTQVVQDPAQQPQEECVLHLQIPDDEHRVRWSSDTVDNEGMNKKKSKCCCIYKKKREWNESDSDSDCETGHCRGHVDKHKNPPDDGGSGNNYGAGSSNST